RCCKGYRNAHNACIENDYRALLKVLRHRTCNVRLWMYEDCVIYDSFLCLVTLFRHKKKCTMTPQDVLNLIEIARKYKSQQCLYDLLRLKK
ncbi:MAG: hypothetical protein MUO31_07945, partial [Thermodesulfovibrionales bacterium]|nr:hypothetical protein [Thermodesulfovibrionales bacterium]